jgi:putative transposase
MSGARTWWSPREIAEAAACHRVRGVPTTERGVRQLAAREGWDGWPATKQRRREGKGGGREYHLSVLPAPLLAAIERAAVREGLETAVARREAADGGALAAVDPAALAARQRQAMEARGQVLTAISAWAAAQGASRAQAIAAFVAATEAGGAALAAFRIEPGVVAVANDRRSAQQTDRGTRIARSTIYAWFRAWDGSGIAALVPASTREAGAPPAGWRAFLRHWRRYSKVSAADALRTYMAEVTDPAMALTIDQVRYWMGGLSEIERCAGRMGALALAARRPYVIRRFEHLDPTDIYVADGHTFDAEVMDPASRRAMRPEITTVIDVATRRVVGLAISRKENVIAVTEALRAASVGFGIPAIFYSDNGAGYRNKVMDAPALGLLARLGIEPAHSLPYAAQSKGIVERVQQTIWVRLARRLPSYIGADMDPEAKKRAYQRSRADLKAVGASALLPSWEAFRGMCQAEAEAYNRMPHSSLPRIVDPETGKRRHMSPDEAWAAKVEAGFEPVLVEERLRDDLWRPMEPRVVQRGMVAWNTNRYIHPALAAHEGKTVLVGYDDADARLVWIRLRDGRSGEPGPLLCVAEFAGGQDYFPRTRIEAARLARAKGRLGRVETARQGILDELRPAALIEAPAAGPDPLAAPLPEIALAGLPVPAPANDAAPRPARAPGGVPAAAEDIRSDEDLARWALAGGELHEGQIGLLRDWLGREVQQARLRGWGLDPDQLAEVVRAHTDRRIA